MCSPRAICLDANYVYISNGDSNYTIKRIPKSLNPITDFKHQSNSYKVTGITYISNKIITVNYSFPNPQYAISTYNTGLTFLGYGNYKDDTGEWYAYGLDSGITASISDTEGFLIDSHYAKLSKFSSDSRVDLNYSYAKVLAHSQLNYYKDPQERIQFDTSLFGLDQALGQYINVRRFDETRDTRMRVLGITRDPNSRKVTITGKQEGYPTANLIGCWNMSQGTGANAPDTSGNSYTLTEVGTTTQIGDTTTNFDSGYYFINSKGLLNITGLNPLSITGKIRFTSLSAKRGVAGVLNQYFVYTNGTKLGVKVHSSTASVECSSGTTLATDTWYTFAAIYDTTELRMYLNGYLDEAVSTNPINCTLSIQDAGSAFCIGYLGSTYSYTYGDIKYIQVFDIALNAQEVLHIHEYWNK
jgi:hypothetical protein